MKTGVTLGGLPDTERRLALALVWAGLPPEEMTERQLNEALKARLARAAGFLAIDHVELRRWLVDHRWLTRDNAGSVYRRAEVDRLPSEAAAFTGIDTDDLAARLHAAREERRALGREAWNARQGRTAPRPAR